MKTKVKLVETAHHVSSADDVRSALFAHHHTTRDAGMKPATADQPILLELVSLVSGTLTIRTTSE